MCFSCVPGGYEVGEKVFYTGASVTFADGDKFVHGQQGKVTGACTSKALKGKGVNLRFPGNKGLVGCHLDEVCRLRAAPPLPPPRLRPAHATLPTRPVRPRDSLCRGEPALTARAAARAAAHCPGAGGMVLAGGVVLAGRFGGGGRALYIYLLTPYVAGGCVCAQVSRDAPPPLPVLKKVFV